MTRNLFEAMFVSILALTAASATYSDIISIGGPLSNHDCASITACPSSSTLCPNDFGSCFYCTNPKSQKDCLPVFDDEVCQKQLGTGADGCGLKYEGSCTSTSLPCQGPFIGGGTCSRKLCT